jgi:hypothetical protein
MIRIRWAEGVWALLVLLAAVIGGPALQFEDGGWGWLTGDFPDLGRGDRDAGGPVGA